MQSHRIKKFKLVIITLLLPLLLISCSSKLVDIKSLSRDENDTSTPPPGNEAKNTGNDNKNTEEEITIKLLVTNEFVVNDKRKEAFNQMHPNVKIECEIREYSDTKNIMNEITQGMGYDILSIERDQMGEFSTLDGFEDLFSPPYNAAEITDRFYEHQLSWLKTLDGKKLLALPLTHLPKVTYYREDILKKYGFPTDPEKLAKYMEDPDNWLNMAKELRKHDKWVLSWEGEMLEVYSYGEGCFDKNLKFKLNTSEHARMVELAGSIKKANLMSSLNVWTSTGQEALRDGKIAMFCLGSYGETQLQSWAPQTKGKWKVTSLPFGAYGLDGSPALAISKNSKHKDLAWDLVKIISLDDHQDYLNNVNDESEFLGGQQSNKLYAQLRTKIPISYSTPLDSKVYDLWKTEVQKYYEYDNNSNTAEDALKDIEQKIYNTFGKELEILKKTFIN